MVIQSNKENKQRKGKKQNYTIHTSYDFVMSQCKFGTNIIEH